MQIRNMQYGRRRSLFTCVDFGSAIADVAVNDKTDRIYVVDVPSGTVIVLDTKTHHKIAEMD